MRQPYACHMASIWELYGLAIWNTYGVSGANHVNTHMLAIWGLHIDYVWQLLYVDRVDSEHVFHMANPCSSHVDATQHEYGYVMWLLYYGTWTPHYTDICMPYYGFHVRAIWFGHMKYIWGVGCKPHQYPHVSHMGFTYRLCMTAMIITLYMYFMWLIHIAPTCML